MREMNTRVKTIGIRLVFVEEKQMLVMNDNRTSQPYKCTNKMHLHIQGIRKRENLIETKYISQRKIFCEVEIPNILLILNRSIQQANQRMVELHE